MRVYFGPHMLAKDHGKAVIDATAVSLENKRIRKQTLIKFIVAAIVKIVLLLEDARIRTIHKYPTTSAFPTSSR